MRSKVDTNSCSSQRRELRPAHDAFVLRRRGRADAGLVVALLKVGGGGAGCMSPALDNSSGRWACICTTSTTPPARNSQMRRFQSPSLSTPSCSTGWKCKTLLQFGSCICTLLTRTCGQHRSRCLRPGESYDADGGAPGAPGAAVDASCTSDADADTGVDRDADAADADDDDTSRGF